MKKNQPLILVILGALLTFGLLAYLLLPNENTPPVANDSDTPAQTDSAPENIEPAGFNKKLFAIDKPGSPWWIVNKKRPLPAGYVPADLAVPNVRLRLARTAPQMPFSQTAMPALEEMFQAATDVGVTLVFGSGYRSEELQRQFYESYVAADGQAAADRYSARPGTSEHQTGLAFDVTSPSETCHLEICFEDTPEGKWVISNAHLYGFIVRYPNGKESITGYQYEPWHLRYVGRELSVEMHRTGIRTLEEFFDLPPAATY